MRNLYGRALHCPSCIHSPASKQPNMHHLHIYLPLDLLATLQIKLMGLGGGGWGDKGEYDCSPPIPFIGTLETLCSNLYGGDIHLLYISTLPSHQYNLECCKNFCMKIYLYLCTTFLAKKLSTNLCNEFLILLQMEHE